MIALDPPQAMSKLDRFFPAVPGWECYKAVLSGSLGL